LVKELKGKRRVVVTPEYGESQEYLVPKSNISSSMKGIMCRQESALMEGTIVPNDILRVLGSKNWPNFWSMKFRRFIACRV
jgi:DNA-directed RNA polymerase subunit beta'